MTKHRLESLNVATALLFLACCVIPTLAQRPTPTPAQRPVKIEKKDSAPTAQTPAKIEVRTPAKVEAKSPAKIGIKPKPDLIVGELRYKKGLGDKITMMALIENKGAGDTTSEALVSLKCDRPSSGVAPSYFVKYGKVPPLAAGKKVWVKIEDPIYIKVTGLPDIKSFLATVDNFIYSPSQGPGSLPTSIEDVLESLGMTAWGGKSSSKGGDGSPPAGAPKKEGDLIAESDEYNNDLVVWVDDVQEYEPE